MPSWIGPWEIAIVLVLALLIFGPKKLPDLGSSLGRSITGFKRGLKETKDDVQSAIKEDVTVDGAEATTGVRAEATTATTRRPHRRPHLGGDGTDGDSDGDAHGDRQSLIETHLQGSERGPVGLREIWTG